MMSRTLRIGVAGLGRGFTLMLPTFVADPRVALVAAADPRLEARQQFGQDFGAPAYASVAELCADPGVEVVHVATPHHLHAAHVAAAAAAGKHVLVEKPMAIRLDECQAMIAATRQAGVQLVVGHSHSFDRPIARARDLIAGGDVGPLRMITALNFTDFLYRPRRPEELATDQGGGVIFSQGAHQIDIVRLLGGGRVRSVRALTGAWDETRPTEGAYAALLTFADGAFASVTYSGYGHFDSDEFCGQIDELGQPKEANRYGAARRALRALDPVARVEPSRSPGSESPDETQPRLSQGLQPRYDEAEAALKNARAYGGLSYRASSSAEPPRHQHFGFVIASCERADLRPLPNGVMVYGDGEAKLDPLPAPAIPRVEVIDELYGAVVNARPPLHGGEWSLATLEVCLAILQSARQGREIEVSHQVAVS
jgi:phthalate 4,5-cis-dihydrodiol dehydrogenase